MKKPTPPPAAVQLRHLREGSMQVKLAHLRVPAEPRMVLDAWPLRYATMHALRTLDWGDPSPKGGMTRLLLLDENGDLIATGDAVCRSEEEFDRRLGLTIALGRALKELDRNPRPLGIGAKPVRHHCGRHGYLADGVLVGLPYFPPAPPSRCPACGGQLETSGA